MKPILLIVLVLMGLIMLPSIQAGQLDHDVALNSTACQATDIFSGSYPCTNSYNNQWGSALTQAWITSDGHETAHSNITLNGTLILANITVINAGGGGGGYNAGNFTIMGTTDLVNWFIYNSSVNASCITDWCVTTFYNSDGFPPASTIRINITNETNGANGVGNGEIILHEWDGVGPVTPPLISDLTIDAVDSYDSTGLLNLSVTLYNSTHTFTNGSMTGSVIFGNLLNLSNYTVNISSNVSGGYFNRSVNASINGTTIKQIQMHQALVYFNATQFLTGDLLTGLNVSTLISNTTTGSLALLLLKANTNITVLGNVTGYFSFNLSVNVTPLSNTTIQLVFHDVEFNITLFDSRSNATVQDYTLVVDYVNFSTSVNHTTLTESIVNIRALSNNVLALSGTTSNNVHIKSKNFSVGASGYYNFSMFSQAVHSIFLEFYHETTHIQFDNETVNIGFIGPSVINYSTNNGSLFAPNLTPGFYEIRYSGVNSDARSFFINIPLGESGDVDLFLLNTSLSTLVVFNIVDENDKDLNGTILFVLRRYVFLDQFDIVEMARSDFNGEAVTNIIINDQFYRFIVTDGNLNALFDSTVEVKITSETPQIRVQLGKSTLAFVEGLAGLYATNITYAAPTFSYTLVDTTGIVDTACLTITRLSASGNEQVNESCMSGTGTLTVSFNNTIQGTYIATATLNTTDNNQVVIDTLTQVISSAVATFGNLGVFLGMIIMMSILLLYPVSSSVSVVVGFGSLLVGAAFGLIAMSVGSILALIIVGLLFVFGGRKR